MKRGAEAAAVRSLRRCPRAGWLWLLLASLAVTQVAASPESEVEPFERMRQALSSLNYSGVLVYSHDNRMETLRIVQRVTNGRVQAELESLNGPPRGMKQDGGQVTVPAATILTYRGDLVSDYRIFVDPSPLFA